MGKIIGKWEWIEDLEGPGEIIVQIVINNFSFPNW